MRLALSLLLLSLFSFCAISQEVAYTKDGRMGTKCFPEYQGSKTGICTVSIIQLALTPEKYHGKIVRVKGTLLMRHEVTGIKSGDHKIWIQTDNLEKYSKLDSKRVQVQGVFNALSFGHGGMWDGSIENPTEVRFIASL
ncbi:hypothetical protein [Litorilituus sediminis]|uniref:Uncharacterized protein n=1 Tax=Litorilituus sediminis TaxID=718192 RepID=A0A4P6P2H2_9GAMM|nr:hypothetical protein [Litorilituus sediminis]QBG34848.1 hypothetical protein EMK97_03370 [Litorilituus sediminis]